MVFQPISLTDFESSQVEPGKTRREASAKVKPGIQAKTTMTMKATAKIKKRDAARGDAKLGDKTPEKTPKLVEKTPVKTPKLVEKTPEKTPKLVEKAPEKIKKQDAARGDAKLDDKTHEKTPKLVEKTHEKIPKLVVEVTTKARDEMIAEKKKSPKIIVASIFSSFCFCFCFCHC